jgi:hypothetical protein
MRPGAPGHRASGVPSNTLFANVAAVIWDQQVRLFFDGVPRATVPDTRPILYPGDDVTVGRRDQHDGTTAVPGRHRRRPRL